jgi:hypothetical protein
VFIGATKVAQARADAPVLVLVSPDGTQRRACFLVQCVAGVAPGCPLATRALVLDGAIPAGTAVAQVQTPVFHQQVVQRRHAGCWQILAAAASACAPAAAALIAQRTRCCCCCCHRLEKTMLLSFSENLPWHSKHVISQTHYIRVAMRSTPPGLVLMSCRWR